MGRNWLGGIERVRHRVGLFGRPATLTILFTFTASCVTGCGGGGSSASSTIASTTIAGYFSNISSSPQDLPCCTHTLQEGSMAVSTDGTTYLVTENGTVFAGRLTFTTDTALSAGLVNVTGSGVAYSPTSYSGIAVASQWGTPISGVTLTGTLIGTALQATLTIPGIGTYAVSAGYNSASQTPVSSASLTGNYKQVIGVVAGPTVWAIDGNGLITGSSADCPAYNGNATMTNAAYDVFSITLTCTPASGSPYTMTGLSARGAGGSGVAGGTGLLVMMLADPSSGKSLYISLAKQ